MIQRFVEVMSALKNEHAVDLYRYKGVVCVKEGLGLRVLGFLGFRVLGF